MGIGMSQSQENVDKPRKKTPGPSSEKKKSTAKNLLKFAGTWQGDDLEECLDQVYQTRGEATF